MQYQVVQKLIWNCCVINVSMHTNRQNGRRFVLVKLGKYENGQFLCSIILNEYTYEYFLEEMKTKKLHTIERLAIRPNVNVYHILTWDDVDRGKCTRNNIGEVERNKNGIPVVYNQIVIFANVDGMNTGVLRVDDVLAREYIEINSPNVNNAIRFNNRANFLAKQAQKTKQCEELMDSMYDAYKIIDMIIWICPQKIE